MWLEHFTLGTTLLVDHAEERDAPLHHRLACMMNRTVEDVQAIASDTGQ
jgi:hypothetical protein